MSGNIVTTLVRHDLRMQWRYGIHGAYLFVIAFYLAVLLGMGAYLPDWVVAVLIFSDPAAVGFFFLGALMMLERTEGVRAAIAVTPVSAGDYVAAKTITLTGLAVLAGALLLPVVHSGANGVLLLVTVFLTSIQYLGIGVPIALRFRTVTGYLIGSSGILIPIVAPGYFAFVDPTPVWLYLLPAVSQLELLLVATGATQSSLAEIALMLGVLAIAAAGAMWLAVASLRAEQGQP